MIPCNPINRKIALIVFALSLASFLQISAQDGRQLFNNNCASCHSLTKDMTGPKLGGVLDREHYSGDVHKIVNWVHNADKLTSSDPYYKGLKAQFGTQMTAFPGMPDKDIEAIVKYVSTPVPTTTPGGPTETPTSDRTWVIFGVISLIMAIIALILMQVNNNLKKLSDDKEGILRPEQVPFYKNKVYISLLTIIVF